MSSTRSVFRILSTVLFLLVAGFQSVGCKVSRPSHIDEHLNKIVVDARARPEPAPKAERQSTVAISASNAMPAEERLADSGTTAKSRLGCLYTAGENYAGAVLAWREEEDYLATKQPLEQFVMCHVEALLGSKGIEPAPDAAARIMIVVDRLRLDFEADMFTCNLEVTIEATGSDPASPVYRRQFLGEATAPDDNADEAVGLGPIVALALEENKGSVAALEGAFRRFEEELLADSEFWNAIR